MPVLTNKIVADRVRQRTTVENADDINFTASIDSYQDFADVLSVGDQTYYCIADAENDDFEVGIGTFTGAGELSRDTVLASSNGGASVSFSSGTKDVFIVAPAALLGFLSLEVNGTENRIKDLAHVGLVAFTALTITSNQIDPTQICHTINGSGDGSISTILNPTDYDTLIIKVGTLSILSITNSGNIVTPNGKTVYLESGDFAYFYYDGSSWLLLNSTSKYNSNIIHTTTPISPGYRDSTHLIDMATIAADASATLVSAANDVVQTYKLTSQSSRKVFTLSGTFDGSSGRKLYLKGDAITVKATDVAGQWTVVSEKYVRHRTVGKRTSAQAGIAPSTNTKVTFNSNEDNCNNFASNQVKILKPENYGISAFIKMSGLTAGTKVQLLIYKNNTIIDTAQGFAVDGSVIVHYNGNYALVLNDKIKLYVNHNDSVNRSVDTARLEVIETSGGGSGGSGGGGSNDPLGLDYFEEHGYLPATEIFTEYYDFPAFDFENLAGATPEDRTGAIKIVSPSATAMNCGWFAADAEELLFVCGMLRTSSISLCNLALMFFEDVPTIDEVDVNGYMFLSEVNESRFTWNRWNGGLQATDLTDFLDGGDIIPPSAYLDNATVAHGLAFHWDGATGDMTCFYRIGTGQWFRSGVINDVTITQMEAFGFRLHPYAAAGTPYFLGCPIAAFRN